MESWPKWLALKDDFKTLGTAAVCIRRLHNVSHLDSPEPEQITVPGHKSKEYSSLWKTVNRKRNSIVCGKVGKKRRGEVSRPSPQSPKGILG